MLFFICMSFGKYYYLLDVDQGCPTFLHVIGRGILSKNQASGVGVEHYILGITNGTKI